MCGIAGYIGTKNFYPIKSKIKSCIKLMKLRGPDFQDFKEFELISSHPYRCKKTLTFPNLFICIITKQTSAIYKINESKLLIEVVTIFDNRQNPNKLKTEIKNHFGLF